MRWLILLAAAAALFFSTATASAIKGSVKSDQWPFRNVVKPEKDWFESGVFYQIYPRSFKDSDGDGVGDIKGITQSLEHLKDLGVTGTWLSPIFKSPMRDFGYDIADFYNVDEIFGTNQDLAELFAKAKQLDIKIILDFVPNHSSNESEWFVKSEQRLDGFDDWYVWHDSKGVDENGEQIPPSNWVSAEHKFPFIATGQLIKFHLSPISHPAKCVLWLRLDMEYDSPAVLPEPV